MFTRVANALRGKPAKAAPAPARQDENDAKTRARLAAKTKQLQERGGAAKPIKEAPRADATPEVDMWEELAPERKKSVSFHPLLETEPLRRIMSEGDASPRDGTGKLKGILKTPTAQAPEGPARAGFNRHKSM